MRPIQRAEISRIAGAERWAGPPSDDGDRDARFCRQIVARHARTFSLASWLLPPAKRRAAYAVYATCRIADDIVDTGGSSSSSSAALYRFREAAFHALERRSDQPVLRELARAWHAFQFPGHALEELFDALELDLVPQDYSAWPDVERYCQGVAGSVGEICCSVFGTADDQGSLSRAVLYARTLGVAMQLTNILRDVGEDARRGRCYLPANELAEFGLDPGWVRSGGGRDRQGAWERFLMFQVERGRGLYRQAHQGIPLLKPDAQSCALACAEGYSKILDAIAAAPEAVLTRRTSASRLALLGVVWRSWRRPTFLDARTR